MTATTALCGCVLQRFHFTQGTADDELQKGAALLSSLPSVKTASDTVSDNRNTTVRDKSWICGRHDA